MWNARPQRRAEAGFTLVELMVVILIIGLLASLAIVSLIDALDRARQRATMADMRTISRALEAYAVDNNSTPDDSDVEAALRSLIPYQANSLNLHDHWGRLYSYESDVAGNYTLMSFGKDGTDGADLTIATRHEYERDLVISNGLFTAAPE